MDLSYVMWSNVMWKSMNLNMATSRLICPTMQRRRWTSNQGALGPDSTLEFFASSSAAWYTTVIIENWPRDATSKPRWGEQDDDSFSGCKLSTASVPIHMQFSLQCSGTGPIKQQVTQSTHRLSSSLAALCNKLKLGPHGIPCPMEPLAVNDGNVTRRHDVISRENMKFVFHTKDYGAETNAACPEGRQVSVNAGLRHIGRN
jgi:hypothetical protein